MHFQNYHVQIGFDVSAISRRRAAELIFDQLYKSGHLNTEFAVADINPDGSRGDPETIDLFED